MFYFQELKLTFYMETSRLDLVFFEFRNVSTGRGDGQAKLASCCSEDQINSEADRNSRKLLCFDHKKIGIASPPNAET